MEKIGLVLFSAPAEIPMFRQLIERHAWFSISILAISAILLIEIFRFA
jgi:hypothetical protein